MANAGIKGASAGTYLSQALQQLTGPSDKAKGLMGDLAAKIGMSGDIAFDSSGKMRPLTEIIRLTGKATADMTDEQKDYYLTTILGSEGMKAFLPLMAAGTDGWNKMRDAVTKQNAAGDMAAARMKGLGGAVKGLSSTMETLALEGVEPLLPLLEDGVTLVTTMASSFQGKLGPAVSSVVGGTRVAIDVLSSAAAVIEDNALPAVAALGTATMVYALTQLPTLGASVMVYATTQIPILVAAVGTAATSMGAMAVAALATLGPLALIAGAVYEVVKAAQDLQEKLHSGAQQLLESRQWWNDSTKALDDYSKSSEQVKFLVEGKAQALEALRTQQQGELEDLARRKTLGGMTEAQYNAELKAINDRIPAIRDASNALEHEIQLYSDPDPRREAIEGYQAMTGAQAELQKQTLISREEFDKLNQELEKIREKGGQALSDLASTHAGFVKDFEQRQTEHDDKITALMKEKADAQTADQRKAIDERIAAEQAGYQQQSLDAARHYAEQAAQQRSALGEQLLAYIENQREMNRISDAKAAELREATITHFGVMRDSAAAMFGDMATTVSEYASGAIKDTDGVKAAWGRTEDAAVTLKEKADKLKDKYVMEILADIDKPGANIDTIRKKIADVDRRVEIEITTTHRDVYVSGSGDHVQGGGVSGTRASGGPVLSGTPYLVGERGPEMFIPDEGGTIVPSGRTAPAGGGNTYILQYYGQSGVSAEQDVAQALRVQQLLMG